MLNLTALLSAEDFVFGSPALSNLHNTLSVIMIILMFVSAVVAIILVLMQPSNSSGIDALGGSSETFFGKNKGKSIEAKMKKWTWICLAVLLFFSVAYYALQTDLILSLFA